MIAGAVSFLLGMAGGESEWQAFPVSALGLLVCVAIGMFVSGRRRILRAGPLPADATVLTSLSTAGNALLAAVPPGIIVYISTSPDHATWAIGLGCLCLGLGLCGIATAAARTEKRRGTRVFRTGSRYYIAR